MTEHMEKQLQTIARISADNAAKAIKEKLGGSLSDETIEAIREAVSVAVSTGVIMFGYTVNVAGRS